MTTHSETTPLRTVEIIITNTNGKQIKHKFPIVSELSIEQTEDDFIDTMERYFGSRRDAEEPPGKSMNIRMKLRAHYSEENNHVLKTEHTHLLEGRPHD